MKISRSIRADIRRTYYPASMYGLPPAGNVQSVKDVSGDARARWSRFREAAKDLVTADTLDALEAAWNATEQGVAEPAKVDPAPVENVPFKVGDRVRIAHPQPRPFREAPPLGWEGRIDNYLPNTRDPFWVFDGGPTPGTGWWCSANELELVSEPPPARPFKVGDRVRVIKSDLKEVDQLEVGSEGSITGCNHEGDTPNERKACWRVQTSSMGRWSYGWHADDDLELINP